VPTWHLLVDNGSTKAVQGEAERPDLRLRLSWQDWADIVGERLSPLQAVATGRLRPRGNPLALRKLMRVFPQS
jgi:putative sterol carrier protein